MAKRKKINPRVLLVLCVLGVILVGAIVAFAIRSLPKDPTADIQTAEAEAAKTNPDWEIVFRNLGRARANTKDPKASANLWFREAELRFERVQKEPNLSRLQLDEQQQKGWGALMQAVRQDNQHLKARMMLSQLYGAIARANPDSSKAWQNFIGELDGILSVDPKDSETYFRRAVAYAQLALTDPQYQNKAIEDFRKAVELDKTNAEYQDFLARFLVSIGQMSEAEQVLKEAIQSNPNKALIRVSYARFLRQQKRMEEAEKQIQEAVQCEPSSPLGYLDQAGNLIVKRNLDEAEAILKKAQQIAPTDVQVYAQYLLLYRLKNDRQAAERILREGLAALDKEEAQAKDEDKVGALRRGQIRATLNYMLTDILLDLYATSEDEKEKEKFLTEAKERYQILSTLSTSQLQKDHIAGRIAYFEKKWADAREALEKVVDQDPTSRVAVMLLNVYRQLGIPGQSEKLAERILEQRRLSPEGKLLFLLELAQLQIGTGEYDKAQLLIDQAAKINPGDANVKRVQQALDAYHGKTAALTDQQQNVGQMTRAMFFRRVQELVLNDQNDEAEALLDQMFQQNPADLQVLSQLVSLLMETQKQDKALECIAKAQEKDPKNEDLKRIEAVLKETSSDKRYEIEMGFVDRGTSEDELTKLLQKWSIAARYGKAEDAKTFLEKAEKIDPNNNVVINIRFRDALLSQNWAEAEGLILRIQEDETGFLQDMQRARLAMAHGQAEKTKGNTAQADDQFAQALSYLQTIEQKAPYLPIPRLLMAECHRQLGKLDEAKKQLKICYDNDPQNLQALIGLAQIAQQGGLAQEQRRWIEEAYKLPSGKADPYVQEQYLQILESDPQQLRDVTQRRERVLKRDPDNLDNAFRLAVLYERSGQLNRAQDMIEYIYQRTSAKVNIAPMLADLYLRMNRPTKADEMFSDLLKSAKTNEEKVITRIAYADYLAKSDEASAWRMYEMAAAEEGDNGTKALQAMSNFRAAQAQYLASQGNTKESQARWNESIDLLKKVIDGDPSNKQMQRALLQRYIDSGQFDNAVAGYQNMIQTDPNDTDARLGLGLTYLRNDQLDNAEEQLNEVIRINPDLPYAYQLRSRIYQSRMELSKAASDINTSASLTGNLRQKLDLARVYEAMGDVQQAAQTYDAILAENPEEFDAYQGLLNLFQQQKRWSALDALARKGMKVMPNRPEFALSLAAAAKEQGNTTGQLHWMQRASEAAPDNPSVVWQYWMTLLKNNDYAQLQRETQKYGNRPSQVFGARAVLTAAQVKKDPNSAKPFQDLLSVLSSAKNPYEVYFVGQLLEESCGPKKIVAQSSAILQARPKDVSVYTFLGDMCLREKSYRQAEQYYQEALGLTANASGKIPVYLRLAQMYSQESAYPKTEAQYLAILKDNPNNIIALNNLAYTYIEYMDRPEDGLKLIQRAMKITPGDPNLVDTYAWSLARLGRFEESREMFEKVISVGNTSNSAERLYHMGYVLEKTGTPRDAMKYYRQALEVARAQKDAKLQEMIQAAVVNVEKELGKE